MRVLCVGNLYPPHHFGGYELVWQGAVAHWRAAGHEVRVLTTTYRDPDLEDGADDEPGVQRELHWYWRDHAFQRLGPWAAAQLERHNARAFGRNLADFEPDVVVWWAMGAMSLSLFAQARRARLPQLAVVHDGWPIYGPRVDRWTAAWASRPRLGALAERLTGIPAAPDTAGVREWSFNSETSLARVRESGWPMAGAQSVAHPGIDHVAFAPRALDGHWGGRLLCAGRIEPQKGLLTAVDALAELPGATLTIAGGGDEAHVRELSQRSEELEIPERVIFTGALSRAELAGAYADADAVVFPVTWPEPWGLVPLEAMAVGRPIAATITGGAAEYLRDGENCVAFEPGDAAGLAGAVRLLAGDGELRARLADAGRETAARFTEAAFHGGLDAALARVAA